MSAPCSLRAPLVSVVATISPRQTPSDRLESTSFNPLVVSAAASCCSNIDTPCALIDMPVNVRRCKPWRGRVTAPRNVSTSVSSHRSSVTGLRLAQSHRPVASSTADLPNHILEHSVSLRRWLGWLTTFSNTSRQHTLFLDEPNRNETSDALVVNTLINSEALRDSFLAGPKPALDRSRSASCIPLNMFSRHGMESSEMWSPANLIDRPCTSHSPARCCIVGPTTISSRPRARFGPGIKTFSRRAGRRPRGIRFDDLAIQPQQHLRRK